MGAAPILNILRDGETIRSCPIEGEVVLGRAAGCVIRLEDRAISRHHAVFRPVAGGIQVERRSEFAPLMVNGADCTTAVVKEGDVISIGPYLMRLAMSKGREERPEGSGALHPLPQADTTLPPEAPDAAAPEAEALLSILPEVSEAPGSGKVEVEPPEAAPESSSGGVTAAMDLDALAAGEAAAPVVDSSSPSLDPTLGGAGHEQGTQAELIEDDGRTKVAAPEKLSVRLMFREGDANVTEFELTQDEISIGRGKNCDIVLQDKKSSRKNSIIRRAGLSFIIKDLGSANGTYVNGVRVEEQELSGDDVIQVGDIEFQFKAMSADYLAKQDNFLQVVEEEEPPPAENFDIPFPESEQPAPEPPPAAAVAAAAVANYNPGFGYVPGAAASGAIPGMSGIPGLNGSVGVSASQSNSLLGKWLEKYRNLPRGRQILWTIIILCGVAFLLFEEEDFAPAKSSKAKQQQAASKDKSGAPTFESLSAEQRRYIESQHVMAFDFYKAREYDKALFELDKIFAVVPDYKDSREIERYAREGKRKLEAMQEEKRRKEEEARLKAKITQLEEEGRALLERKQFEQLQEIIGQILAHDPENAAVARWREELERREEARLAEEQRQSAQAEVNKEAWRIYRNGLAYRKKGQFRSAIAEFLQVREVGPTDTRLVRLAEKMLRSTQAQLREVRDPMLAEAREAETASEYVKAFGLYLKATRIDPSHPEGFAGMDRIRGFLHERAKVLYTEAVLAESYSDFETARRKFEECHATAPPEDIYRERAQRKLARYIRKPEAQQ